MGRVHGIFLFAGAAMAVHAAEPSPEAVLSKSERDFFEAKIRPVLIEHCHRCHAVGAEEVKADYLLDTREGIRKGGASGRDAVIPGDPAGSRLLAAIRHLDPELQMPPKSKLPDAVVADFEAWIAMGAPDPRDGTSRLPRELAAESHWAFQPLASTEPPAVKDGSWPRDRIDRFVLARLEAAGLKPARDAARRTLIRRATLELTGLPPDPAAIRAFLGDPAPDDEAFVRVVDRLLASPRFGERWGRHWLDVARYGESSGYSRNMLYPYAWRYRDWVIDAFNRDLPFDDFIRQQIAGDLLPAATPEQRERQTLGTGFLTVGPKTLDEDNVTLFDLNVADDQIDATMRAFLALTANCARCHDHKYDPFPTRDYYALAGIFRSSRHLGGVETNTRCEHAAAFPLGPDGEERVRIIAEKTKAADEAQKTYLEIVKKRNEIRDPLEKQGIDWKKSPTPELVAAEAEVQRHQALVKAAQAAIPAPPDFAMAVLEGRVMSDAEWKTAVEANAKDRKIPLPSRIADSPVYAKGLVAQPLDPVPRGVPGLFAARLPSPAVGEGESGRLQLAEWLTDPRHPLTARVYVNRVWHHLFGTGLVATVDNFGLLGEAPSHPELLDDLARRFAGPEMRWSTKRLLRTILLSRAWRLDAAPDPAALAVDPDNRLLWRFAPQAAEAEVVRDSLLFVAGTLEDSPAGPSQVETIAKTLPNAQGREIGRKNFYLKDATADVPCRSVYLPVARSAVFDVMSLFDLPDPNLVSGARQESVVPSQMLFLLNSPVALAAARAAAGRILTETPQGDVPALLTAAFERVYGRSPEAEETEASLAFLKSAASSEETEAWAMLMQALMSAGEFRTID
jgi:hypothetical protein